MWHRRFSTRQAWGLGAVSTAEWAGVPFGLVVGHDAPVRFERGLSFDQIREADALLAYEMNGEPLSPPHGYPLRLIVPSWYALASVKWLTEILATDKPLRWALSIGEVLVPVGAERARR